MEGESVNASYRVLLSGVKPDTLTEGANVLDTNTLKNLNCNGVAIHKADGEMQFITQGRLTTLEFDVTDSIFTRVAASGNVKTTNGVKENFEIEK